MNELKSKPNTNPSAVSIIKKVLLLGFEYKRTLANNIEKLTEVDGFNDWRNNEITDLSNVVQTRLHYLQNPLNCESARKLVCTISYGCGFGCQMHHLISCMILAYGMQRTLILESTGWQYHRGGWNQVFMPLSKNCTTVSKGSIDNWPGTNNSKIIRIPPFTYILPRSHYLPLAVPEDLFVRLKTIHGNPTVWWIGQLLKYIWKPNNLTTNYINGKTKKLDMKSPIVGVHIRRTDKIINEAKYIAIEEYMKKVDEYYSLIEIKSNVTKRRVYIATEDFNVITEAKTKYPHYEIFYNENIPKIPKTNPIHSNDNILDVILDIHVLVNSNFLVCTFSSNIGRLAYALKQINYVDASTKCVSLDAVYVYTQQNRNQCKTILNHKARTTDEIDLYFGDIINITQYTLNGEISAVPTTSGSTVMTNKNNISEERKCNWTEWNPTNLRQEKHHALNMPASPSEIISDGGTLKLNEVFTPKTLSPYRQKKMKRCNEKETYVQLANKKIGFIEFQMKLMQEEHDAKMQREKEKHELEMLILKAELSKIN
ncbi:hypothetical protein RN001_006006 [Aquatica leii]|uniref:GT23 domain-containing protein n=1 Tax=Aquatica leii TaxID=1421715 RepID=A0AAN7PCK2_9COLE|nr:hypothetical protein RN001_006006 [Aquatica leii]